MKTRTVVSCPKCGAPVEVEVVLSFPPALAENFVRLARSLAREKETEPEPALRALLVETLRDL